MLLTEAQKPRRLTGIQKIKTVIMKFQMEMRTLLSTGLETISVTFWQRTCLYFVDAMRLGGRLNLKVLG
jgi:hypothetical protein